MDLSYPEKYHRVAKYFDNYIGDIEQTPLLSDAQRLLFYALRQQADHGPCTTPQPSMWYMTERHKHQAWKQLERMSTFEAMVFFVQQFERVLWTLEHPEDDSSSAAKAPMCATIDWAARLRAVEGEPSTEVVSAHGGGDTSCSGAGESSSASPALATSEVPSSSPPADEVKSSRVSPSPAPPPLACLSAEEMEGWDDDVVAHATPSLDNIRYLAAELMRARLALRQAPAPATGPASEAQRHADGCAAEELPVLSPPLEAATPPLKPVCTVDGRPLRTSALPPPIRFSARSLTAAALGLPRESRAVRAPQPCSAPPPPDANASWFAW